MHLGPDDCNQLGNLLRAEWLETDGLGNYASGTVAGINTRHYHGLLVAEGVAGAGRRVLCAQVNETLHAGASRYEFSAIQFGETVHPQGYRHLVGFRLDPWPTWTYELGSVRLEKQLLMLQRTACTLLRYRILAAPGPVALEVRPLVAGRDYHSTAMENWSFRRQSSSFDSTLEMMPYDEGSRVVFGFPHGRFQGDGLWFYNVVYVRETERGLEDHEDLFDPGLIAFTLHQDESAELTISTRRLGSFDLAAAVAAEQERRTALGTELAEPLQHRLVIAADAFVVEADARPAVVAGYPWFEVWQRAQFIALPGLTLATGRPALARELLDNAAARQRAGAGEGGREGIGADVPFWFAWAARHYLAATGDQDFAKKQLRPAVEAILSRLLEGRIEGVSVAEDGLVTQGLPHLPLTWMDALWQGEVFTPRRGKAIEINALWHLTLRLATELGLAHKKLLARVRESFLARYWSAERGYLLDVADGPDGDDESFRPNQLLAVSLEETLLPREVASAVFQQVTERLLTPFGLRTLAPGDPRYRPRYEGNAESRDAAYHNGTVWPWLLGPYADALIRLEPDGRTQAAALLEPFREHLDQCGIGQVSEIFDAEPEHEPRGCIAHAPAVGELLRIAAITAGDREPFWPAAGPSK